MLIDSIKANQKARGWNATELSRQLRISPSTWSRILTGERRIGLQFLRAAAKTFPELHWEIANYVLKGDNHDGKRD
ncbi:hypothetical protein CMI37_08425 [Candidatus Pacearchaeota archaeon]|nr:hypothetical protein [Candidatus Pacearchaeota archaeon]|tara:strand:+ start:18100 stop:18327 length:228 start_codon:yes stop_codon:yes gene_type:complete